jgi:AcrR family transcriptional regulator
LVSKNKAAGKVPGNGVGKGSGKDPGSSRRVRLPIDERRAQLLALGTRLFSSRSYDDISIDDVAEQAGISKGLLYHYFGGKKEFYVEVLRATSEELRRLTEPDPTLSPGERLRHAVDAHLNYVQENKPVYAAIYTSGAAIAREANDILEEHREVVLGYFLRDFGITRPRPILRAALRAWMAMVEGACLDWIAHPELARADLCELLIAGYAAMLERTIALDPPTARTLEKLAAKAAAKPARPAVPDKADKSDKSGKPARPR